MSAYEHWNLVWSAIQAAGAIASTIIVAIAAAFGYTQLREASRARQLEGALAVLECIDSPDHRRVRRFIFTHHHELAKKMESNPNLKQLDSFLKDVSNEEVDFQTLHSYLASLENVSILVVHDLAPDDIVEMYYGNLAPHHWQALQPLIMYMRNLYESDDYLQHFEMLNKLLGAIDSRTQRLARRISHLKPGNTWSSRLNGKRAMKRQILHARRLARDKHATVRTL